MLEDRPVHQLAARVARASSSSPAFAQCKQREDPDLVVAQVDALAVGIDGHIDDEPLCSATFHNTAVLPSFAAAAPPLCSPCR